MEEESTSKGPENLVASEVMKSALQAEFIIQPHANTQEGLLNDQNENLPVSQPTSIEEPVDEIGDAPHADSSGRVLEANMTATSWGAAFIRRMYHARSGMNEPINNDLNADRSEADGMERQVDGWMLVDAAKNEVQRRMTRLTAFDALSEWEAARVLDFKNVSEQHANILTILHKRASLGKEELSECIQFLSQRAAADAQYAQAISRMKLGGQPVLELGDLRKSVPPTEVAAMPLADACGCEELRAVRAVLGCMTVQCSEKLQRFAADDSHLKEVGAALGSFSSVCDGVLSACAMQVDEIQRSHRACVDAFQAFRLTYEASVKREAKVDEAGGGVVDSKDLWLTECVYKSEVATSHSKLWQARRSIRELLERFRVAEHKRVTTLHGALRVFVSLQQRLWADISASTTAVNAIFKERSASTALVDQPNAIALEALTTDESNGEYISRSPPPPSLLVLHEGAVQYQRSLVRTWVNAYAILTTDRFIHVFSSHPDGQHSSRVRATQLLFSLRCAKGLEPVDVSTTSETHADADERVLYYFAVPTRVDGLWGKVSSTVLRTLGRTSHNGWLVALRQALQ